MVLGLRLEEFDEKEVDDDEEEGSLRAPTAAMKAQSFWSLDSESERESVCACLIE